MSETIIRPAGPDDARAIAQVRVDSWRTTYQGMIPAAYLAAMSVDDSAALWLRVLTAASRKASVFIAGNRGARAFYEVLGAELLVEQPFQWDGMDLVEAGYGWRDLDALGDALSGPAAFIREPAAKAHSGEKA